MAKTKCIVLLCVIVTILSGCKQDNMKWDIQVDNNAVVGRFSAEAVCYTLEQIINKSNCAIIGEYVETLEHDYYVEHCFKVSKTLYGKCDETEIFLFCQKADVSVPELSYAYAKDAAQYTEGREYILIMERLESVFYEHDRYLLISDTFLPVDQDSNQRLYNISLGNRFSGESQSLENYVISYKASVAGSKTDVDESLRYTHSTDINEIINVTDYIIKARVEKLMAEGLDTPCATYYCTPLEIIMGEEIICNDNGMIGITVPLNTVVMGDTYYFLVNHVDDLSILYRVSSMNSILEDDSTFSSLIK